MSLFGSKRADPVLGLDGGGSNTDAVFVLDGIRIDGDRSSVKGLIEHRFGPGNPSAIGKEGMEELAAEIVSGLNLVEHTGGALGSVKVVGGFAGIETPGDVVVAEDAFAAAGFNRGHMHFLKDSEFAVYALGGDAIALLAGTGSACYGELNGVTVQAGGWGPEIGDEGSGFYQGKRAIIAAIMAYDGTGDATVLEQIVREHFAEYYADQYSDMPEKLQAALDSLDDLKNIIPLVYGRPKGEIKDLIAKLSPKVFEAAHNGDIVAADVLEESADHLAKLLGAVSRKLGVSDTVTVGLRGGVFQDPYVDEVFLPALTHSVRLHPFDLDFITFGTKPGMQDPILLAMQRELAG